MGREQGVETRPTQDLEHCLLLIRAPSDRSIYETFRAVATHDRGRIRHEQLLIEGNVPLTAGLAAPEVPHTVERLLEAESEMIDKLALQTGKLRMTYVRSGGHAPYRESYFDEIQLDAPRATAKPHEIAQVLETLFKGLSVTSHMGTPYLSELIDDTARRTDRESIHRSTIRASASSHHHR